MGLYNYDGYELERDPEEAAIHECNIRFSVHRKTLAKQGFFLQDRQEIQFFPVCTLASQVRMARALARLPQLPPFFRGILFGQREQKLFYSSEQVLSPPSNSLLTTDMATAPLPTTHQRIRQMVRNQVDPTNSQ